ncbi:unnamed protein product, partial [Iphiclides podalirius]
MHNVNTVNRDTNEETREKYREVIGLNLCPDSHLCYVCCHILNKIALFRSICLKRSLEYPMLFSEKSVLNLQMSDMELHIQCPDETCQGIDSGKCYQINYDTEWNNDDILYNDENQQYVKLEEENDCKHPDDFTLNMASDKGCLGPFDTEVKTENRMENTLTLNQTDVGDIEYTTLQEYDDVDDHQNDVNQSPYHNETDDKLEITADDPDVGQNAADGAIEVDKKKNKSRTKKKSFQKIMLSLDEQKAELETNRRGKKYVEAEFKCYNCALGFLFKDTYQAHMMRHEESNGEHRCTLCTLRFASPSVLRSHAALHAERHRCSLCGQLVGRRSRRRHAALCHGASAPEVACHLCAGLFRDSSGLQQHLRRVHNPRAPRPYPCGVCGEQCRDQAAVRTHMLKHLKKKFACDRCPAVYSSPYTLNRHKRSHETAEERHFCSCGLSYASRKGLLAHRRNSLAHQQTVFECAKCSRVLPHRRALEAHERRAHSEGRRVHPSALCNRPRKPPAERVCQLCGKRFKGNSKLNRHLKEVCQKAKMDELIN